MNSPPMVQMTLLMPKPPKYFFSSSACSLRWDLSKKAVHFGSPRALSCAFSAVPVMSLRSVTASMDKLASRDLLRGAAPPGGLGEMWSSSSSLSPLPMLPLDDTRTPSPVTAPEKVPRLSVLRCSWSARNRTSLAFCATSRCSSFSRLASELTSATNELSMFVCEMRFKTAMTILFLTLHMACERSMMARFCHDMFVGHCLRSSSTASW
mmetsp:Transcript_5932/g.20754  ORF Transcript_5932/g.20754 Transcript_5932/m.20754 type:complete len:209 (+) Transcript_5932:7255-7881(+)